MEQNKDCRVIGLELALGMFEAKGNSVKASRDPINRTKNVVLPFETIFVSVSVKDIEKKGTVYALDKLQEKLNEKFDELKMKFVS